MPEQTSRMAQAAAANPNGMLIAYLPVAFPSVEASIDAAVAVAEAGVSALELGIPYSDPGMDGPVIQAATQSVLDGGFTMADVFRVVEGITAQTDIPVLSMTYWNPVYRYGVPRFAEEFAAAGGAGLITPDLTPENATEWIACAEEYDLDRVFFAAPSSTDARLEQSITASRGFVYSLSTMGITGTRQSVDDAARAVAARVVATRERLGIDLPQCVGLGISAPEHVAGVLEYAEGAIVGSALVAALADGGVQAAAKKATALVAGIPGR